MSKVIASLLLIAAFVCFAYSQNEYSFSILNNGTCVPFSIGTCYACEYSSFYPPAYYKITPQSWGYDVYQYYDDECTEMSGGTGYFSEPCSENGFYGNCYVFARLTSVSALSLTISSSDDLEVLYFGEDYYVQIANKKVSATGANLNGLRVRSDGKTFFVEKQVSATQYSSNMGVFTLGETYTHPPFTFSVTASEIDFPLSLGSDVTYISLSPFYAAAVDNENTFNTYVRYDGEIQVELNSELSLEGLVVGNPLYAAYNMTVFPPFGNNDFGTLVFQLEASSSPFITVECYIDSDSNGSTKFTEYECEMGSLSFLFSGSWGSWGSGSWGPSWSFSLDDFGTPIRKNNPDEMAFSLF